jgi:Putative Flp pilus-assembly TadE/G-like/von Willebrand factor type A domain
MKQQYINYYLMQRRSKTLQRGIYLPILAILLVSFIAVIGLALELGQLYRAKLRVQRAVDAGVVGASRLMGTAHAGLAKNVAEEIGRENILAIDSRLTATNFSATRNGNILTMSGNTSMPLLLLNVVPGIPKLNNVDSLAKSANQRAAVVLVLDLSGSMRPTCSAAGDTAPYTNKIENLRTAVKDFIDKFQDGWDYVGIIGYNRRGFILQNGPITLDLSQPVIKTTWKNTIDLVGQTFPKQNYCMPYSTTDPLGLGSGTNTDHGLGLARIIFTRMREDPNTQTIYNDANKAIVLITDGAPTVSCSSVGSLTDLSKIACNNIEPMDTAVKLFSDDKVHFNRSLNQSDSIRTSLQIKVHAIGIGTLKDANTLPKSGDLRFGTPLQEYSNLELTDSYQDYTDSDGLHSVYLRRVALFPNDPDEHLGTIFKFAYPAGTIIHDYISSEYFTGGIHRITTFINNNPSLPPVTGQYYSYNPTQSADQLTNMLNNIGRSVVTRLIQ